MTVSDDHGVYTINVLLPQLESSITLCASLTIVYMFVVQATEGGTEET